MSFVQLRCPLTKKLPADPVTIDGKSFERDAFVRHLCVHSNGMYNGRYLRVEHITTDSALLERIQQFLKDSDDKRLTFDWKRRRRWVLVDQKMIPKHLDFLSKPKTTSKSKPKPKPKSKPKQIWITENCFLDVNEARGWLNANNPQRAYEHCFAKKLHEKHDSECCLLMGDVYAAISDHHWALAFYNKITKKSERVRLDVYWSLAQLHRKTKNGVRAIQRHIDGDLNMKGELRARHLMQLVLIYRDEPFGKYHFEIVEPYFKNAARLDRTGDLHMILANYLFAKGKVLECNEQLKCAAKKGRTEAVTVGVSPVRASEIVYI